LSQLVMKMQIVSIASDFNEFPFGRKPEHGPHSGERFRKEYLEPALQRGEHIEISLDGARGLSPSFLEEAFGGLVRAGFGADYVLQHIRIISEGDPSYIAEIESYVRDAAVVKAV
jgi:hypothetical protein